MKTIARRILKKLVRLLYRLDRERCIKYFEKKKFSYRNLNYRYGIDDIYDWKIYFD